MGADPLMTPGRAPRFAEHRPPTAFARTTVDYGGPTARCVCGHSQGRHELPGFDGECVAEHCRCTEYRARVPGPVPPSPAVARPRVTPPKPETIEQLVALARATGDRRALLVIGRIQAMADELGAIVRAHHARARDEAYKARLDAMPKPVGPHGKGSKRARDKTCDLCGQGDLANVGVHKRLKHREEASS